LLSEPTSTAVAPSGASADFIFAADESVESGDPGGGRRAGAYGQAYRPTTLDRTFALIAHRSDIPPPVRAELDTLETAYRAELRSIQAALVEAIRQAEPEAYRRRLDHAPSRILGADSAISDLTAQRATLTKAYAERIQALLPASS